MSKSPPRAKTVSPKTSAITFYEGTGRATLPMLTPTDIANDDEVLSMVLIAHDDRSTALVKKPP